VLVEEVNALSAVDADGKVSRRELESLEPRSP
jgi:hypothetical protein